MQNFAEFKKKQDDLNSKLLNNVENEGKRNDKEVDQRFWYPGVDKAGNGFAIVRFLPSPPGEESPYTKLQTHEFKHPDSGRWYIENSLSTKGQDDPVTKFNRELWNTDIQANKDQASNQKIKRNYFFNVYVIKDTANPENEGKVKIMKGGPWAWLHIKGKLIPEFEGEESVPVFDFWKGADFRIKIYKKGENRQYDKCSFDAPAPFLGGDDDKIEAVWNLQYSLEQFVKDELFKSYEDLEKRLNHVLGVDASSEPKASAPRAEPKVEKKVEAETKPIVDDTDDEDIDFFAKLTEDDDVPF